MCVLVGSGFQYLNNDNFLDIIDSKLTLQKLNNLLPDSFSIEFINTFALP